MRMRRWVLAAVVVCVAASAAAQSRPEQRPEDYRARRQALAKAAGDGIVLLFAPADRDAAQTFAGFSQDPNFYYLSGWTAPGAALLIAGQTASRPYTEVLFLPARNPRIEEWQGRRADVSDPEVKRNTAFQEVALIADIPQRMQRVLGQAERVTIYTDTDRQSDGAEAIAWLRRAGAFPHYTSFSNVRPLLVPLRAVKDEREIALIQHAVDATVEAHLAAMRRAAPNVHEREVHALMMYEFMRRECERPGYAPIVASGPNSTVLHYKDSARVMRAGEVLKIDVGAECGGYVSDITRTLPVSGKFTPRQRELYEIVLGAQRAVEQAFRAGKSTIARSGPGSLHQVAVEYINRFKDAQGRPMGRYFIHGLGHFVGLQVHDVGDSSKPLQPGMVFTIEPGIYIPEENIGIRIEDMYFVGADGKLVKMSARLPSAPDEVERTMAERQR